MDIDIMSSNQQQHRTITVTVYSDLACPWCYIGQKRLQSAIKQFEKEQQQQQSKSNTTTTTSKSHIVAVDVVWKPYQIDPNTNINGEDVEQYNIRRWGSSSWTHHLRSEGAKDGATFINWKWWPNTLRAHQFIQYCSCSSSSLSSEDSNNNVTKQYTTDELNNILFVSLYENGKNISNVNELVAIAKEYNICTTTEQIQQLYNYLQNNIGSTLIQNEIQFNKRKYNIRSVPYFIISSSSTETHPQGNSSSKNNSKNNNNNIILSGAQKSNTFLESFYEVLEL
jgi:predicted DsbA family dithiol-disulfide isomerase